MPKKELGRQILHFSGILFVALSHFIGFKILLGVLLISFFTAIIFRFLESTLKISIVNKISAFTSKHTRKEEKEKKVYLGTAYFFAGLILVLLIFNSMQIFRAAALVLILGDSFSTIFGKLYGKHKIFFNKEKSIEGSFAGFVAAFFGVLTQVSIPIALAISIFGMIIESIPWKLNDNFTIPIFVGALLWLIF